MAAVDVGRRRTAWLRELQCMSGVLVQGAAGVARVRVLRTGLVLRALVDHLAVIQVQLVRVRYLPTWDGGNMQVLDAM
jgi:hypothetical protein